MKWRQPTSEELFRLISAVSFAQLKYYDPFMHIATELVSARPPSGLSLIYCDGFDVGLVIVSLENCSHP